MEYYFYLKAFHVIAFTSWMAMLFYLPRLFVYHAMHRDSKDFTDVVEVQEHKLYYYIGHPSLVMTLLSGIALIAVNPGLFSTGGWLHAKLTVLAFLVAYHFYCGALMKGLKNQTCDKSHVFFRFLNEFPTLVLIAVAIFAVAKPF